MLAWMTDLRCALQLCVFLSLGYAAARAWLWYRSKFALLPNRPKTEDINEDSSPSPSLAQKVLEEASETPHVLVPDTKKRRLTNAKQRKQQQKTHKAASKIDAAKIEGEAPVHHKSLEQSGNALVKEGEQQQPSVDMGEIQDLDTNILNDEGSSSACSEAEGQSRDSHTTGSTQSVLSDVADTSESDAPPESMNAPAKMQSSESSSSLATSPDTQDEEHQISGVTRNLATDFDEAGSEPLGSCAMEEQAEEEEVAQPQESVAEEVLPSDACTDHVDTLTIDLSEEVVEMDGPSDQPSSDQINDESKYSEQPNSDQSTERDDDPSTLDSAAQVDWDLIESDSEDEEQPCALEEVSPPLMWCGDGTSPQGYVAVAVPLECAPPGALDGRWKNAEGERILIERLEIMFESGVTWDMKMHSPTEISVSPGGQEFKAELDASGQQLLWSDGDKWTFFGRVEEESQQEDEHVQSQVEGHSMDVQHLQVGQQFQEQWAYQQQPMQMEQQLEVPWDCSNCVTLLPECMPMIQADCNAIYVDQTMTFPQSQMIPQAAEKWEICWDWKKKGCCPRGNKCEWYHPATTVLGQCEPCDGGLAAWSY